MGLLLIIAALGIRSPLILLGVIVVAVGLVLVLADGPTVPSVRALPVVKALVAVRPEPGTPFARVTEFVAALQPAWWVLRAVAAAVLTGSVFGPVGAVLLLIVAVPVSVWVGTAAAPTVACCGPWCRSTHWPPCSCCSAGWCCSTGAGHRGR